LGVRTAALIGLTALGLAVGFAVLKPEPRALEPASRSLQAALVVPQGTRACERQVDVPAGTGAVELTISTAGEPGGRLPVVIRKQGRVVSRGAHAGGYSDSPVRVRLTALRRAVRGAEVCVANPDGPELALLGAPLTRLTTTQGWIDDLGGEAGPPARVSGTRTPEGQPNLRVRMEWQAGGERSHASYAGTVAERAGLVKAPFLGSGLMWLALGLTLAASLAALALVVREAGGR
jgi:hypothetical protein